MRKNVVAASAAACLALVCFLPPAVTAQVRFSAPAASESSSPVTPTTPFDPVPALSALMPGTSAIRGRACAYADGGLFLARHQAVHLLPVTPYLEEWLELRRDPKRNVAPLPPEVLAARYETRTDHTGRFTFPNLQPGQYYIYVSFAFDEIKTVDAYTGSGYSGFGGRTDYYQRQSRRVGHDTFLERVVGVEREGMTVKVAIRNGSVWKTRAFLNLPCNP